MTISFLKNYTENHQKSQNLNIFLLTSAIIRGLRSVFFNFFFSLYQKYIREFVFKKLLRYLFFFKNYSIFPRGGLWSPPSTPQDMIIFYPPPSPPPHDRVKIIFFGQVSLLYDPLIGTVRLLFQDQISPL